MRKRGKPRKQRPIYSPVEIAVRNGNTLYERSLERLRLGELAAIDAFARGMAGEPEWHEINAMTGISHTMAKAGVGVEAIAACEIATQHLREDYLRFERTGRMGTTGPGLKAYRDVFAIKDLQRQSITERQYAEFIHQTYSKVTVTQQ